MEQQEEGEEEGGAQATAMGCRSCPPRTQQAEQPIKPTPCYQQNPRQHSPKPCLPVEAISLTTTTATTTTSHNGSIANTVAIAAGEKSRGENHTNIIPGVEHVFFETVLEQMEHQGQEEQIVVLAADNSGPSDLAFKFYVDNVSRSGYALHVVHHSNYWGNYEPMDGGPSPKHCQELMVKEDAKVGEIEDKYRKLMAENHISGDFIVLRGKDAWHDIVQYQEKVKGIMIVMGTRGQNTLRRTFMGSVSDSVVHHASCPVLVCCHPKH